MRKTLDPHQGSLTFGGAAAVPVPKKVKTKFDIQKEKFSQYEMDVFWTIDEDLSKEEQEIVIENNRQRESYNNLAKQHQIKSQMKVVIRMLELFYFGPDTDAKKDIRDKNGMLLEANVRYKKRPDMSDPAKQQECQFMEMIV